MCKRAPSIMTSLRNSKLLAALLLWELLSLSRQPARMLRMLNLIVARRFVELELWLPELRREDLLFSLRPSPQVKCRRRNGSD